MERIGEYLGILFVILVVLSGLFVAFSSCFMGISYGD